jgi:hypothetical protein
MHGKILLYSFSLALLILASCGGNKPESDLQKTAITIVSNQSDIVGYGFMDLAALLEKGDFKSINTIGEPIENNYNRIDRAFEVEDKMYFAFAGPLERNGMPSKTIGIATVKDKDSVRAFFTELGYSFEEKGGKFIYYDMSSAIGIDDNLMVFITTGFQVDSEQTLNEVYASMEGEEINENVKEILTENADLLIASNFENLYGTSNTSLSMLPAQQQKELKEMVKNSHISVKLSFNDGEMIIEQDNSRVSEKMKETYFLKPEGAEKVAASIGPGSPFVAMAAAFDIPKMERFMRKFSPESLDVLNASIGAGGKLLQSMSQDQDVLSMINGDIGFNLSNVNISSLSSNIPSFNAYVGLGENGERLKELIKALLQNNELDSLGNNFYRQKGSLIHMGDDAIVVHSNDSLVAQFKIAEITRKAGMEDFGKEPLAIFIDMKQLSAMQLPVPSTVQEVLELMNYCSITGNNEKVVFKLVMNSDSKNALNQLVDRAAEAFSSQLPRFIN